MFFFFLHFSDSFHSPLGNLLEFLNPKKIFKNSSFFAVTSNFIKFGPPAAAKNMLPSYKIPWENNLSTNGIRGWMDIGQAKKDTKRDKKWALGACFIVQQLDDFLKEFPLSPILVE